MTAWALRRPAVGRGLLVTDTKMLCWSEGMEDCSAVVRGDVSKEPRLSRGGLRLLKDEIAIQSGCDASRHGPEDLKKRWKKTTWRYAAMRRSP